MTNFASSPNNNRGFQYPQSGPNNAAEYAASGLPFSQEVTASNTSSTRVDFPFLSSELYIKNNGNNDLAIGWTDNGVRQANRHILHASESAEFRIRVKTVYLFAPSGSTTANVTAALTMISKKNFPVLTGSAAHPQTGEFGFVTGSLQLQGGYDGIG